MIGRRSRLMSETVFPCSTCDGLCCGAVRLTRTALIRIVSHLYQLPESERKRLASQRRDSSTCRLYDTQKQCCSVYPVRPNVCRWFGRAPKIGEYGKELACPKIGHLVQILPVSYLEDEMRREAAEGWVLYSTNFDWKAMI